MTALTLLGLSVEGGERLERRFGPQLARELDLQIGPDGGHVSRNPRVLVELMLDLLPLKATYAARGAEPPSGLIGAMDRIVPHLRMLRHPDGTIGLFNGMGATQIDALATIFASHDVAGRVLSDAPHSGYARLEAGDSVVLVDAGGPPPFAASAEAMAGCGSFEFSDGRQKLVVNCGLPRRAAAEIPVELRGSAAHSVATLDDRPSCMFLSRDGLTRVIEGPRRIDIARSRTEAGLQLSVTHDGYLARDGATLARTLVLSSDGAALDGVDAFSPAQPGGAAPRLARFHLHPSVRAASPPMARCCWRRPTVRPGSSRQRAARCRSKTACTSQGSTARAAPRRSCCASPTERWRRRGACAARGLTPAQPGIAANTAARVGKGATAPKPVVDSAAATTA